MTNAISLLGGTQPTDSKLKLKDAAGKFEALLLQQMLKSARDTDSGGESDPAAAAIHDMAEQHLAEMLGAQGSLGLASMIVKQLGSGESSAVSDRQTGVADR